MRSALICNLLICVSAIWSQEQPKQSAQRQNTVVSPIDRRRDAPKVRDAFSPIVAKVRESVVQVLVDGKPVALGTVVGPDGWIATKASLISSAAVVCRLASGTEHAARIVGMDDANDLAMLRIEAANLPAVEWAPTAGLKPGQWAVSVGQQDAPISIGVVSGPVRKIPLEIPSGRRPVLGIQLAEDGNQGGARIVEVIENGAAAKAGLKRDDVIVKIDGKEVDGRESLQQQLLKSKIGAKVQLAVRRGSELLTFDAVLGDSQASGMFGRQFDRQGAMNRMGGALSERRGRFPAAIQHDAVLKPEECGGPVVDIEGKLIGINISRTGRTESYAIPTDHLKPLLFELASGRLPPTQFLSDAASLGNQQSVGVEPPAAEADKSKQRQ